MEEHLYLWIDLLSIAFPLLASFEERVQFWRKWKGLFVGIAVAGIIFLPWDAWFTFLGIWGFEPRYLAGPQWLGLPLEEWLFFFCIPYACVFLYEVMRHFVRRDVLGRAAPWIGSALSIALLVIAIFNTDHAYTFITFVLCGAFLLFHSLRRTPWLGRFFIGYAVSLIPFFIVNGLLTGSLLPKPVVWYNDAANLGIRLGTIPVEDSMYLLLLLLIVVTFYEQPLRRPHGDLQPTPVGMTGA